MFLPILRGWVQGWARADTGIGDDVCRSLTMASPVSVSRDLPPAANRAVRLTGLGNRLLEVYARRLPRAEFTQEIARLLVDAVRVKAVAIFMYDTHADRLRLLGDVGLSPEARAVLGEGGDCPWDLPLRSLHNRRISVIAAAEENPFVPRGLARVSPRALTLTTLPLFHELKPVGVLLLLAAGHRTFPDEQLQQLSQVLRVCARGLIEPEAPVPAGMPGETASAEAVIARLVRAGAVIEAPELGAVPEPEARPRLDTAVARLLRLENELTETRAELTRSEQSLRALTASYTAVARERDALAQALAAAEAGQETALAELRGQVEALEQRLLAVDSERVRAQRLAEARQQESARALTSMEAERAALLDREDTATRAAAALQAALDAERAQRAEIGARLAELTTQEAEARRRIADLEGTVAAGRESFDEERLRLEAAAAAASATATEKTELVRQLEARLAVAVGERDAARDEATVLTERLASVAKDGAELSAEIERLRGVVTTVQSESAAEAESLRARLADEQAGRSGVEAEAAAAAARDAERIRGLAATLAETQASRDALQATVETLEFERSALQADSGDAAVRLAAAHQQLTDLTAKLAERDDIIARARAERQRLDEALLGAEATAAELSDERNELRRQAEEALAQTGAVDLEAGEGRAEFGATTLPEVGREGGEASMAHASQVRRSEERTDVVFYDTPLTIERSAPPDMELAGVEDLDDVEEEVQAESEPETAAIGEIILLDDGARGDEASQILDGAGFSVTRAALGENTVDDLARRKIHCVILNLAAGLGAWQTLKALRERSGTRLVPILAYALQSQATAGFCFRRADFGLWPMDPDRIAEALRRMRPKLKRLLVVSGDVDTTGRIREPLNKAGISTSIVLDGKQALELSTIVAPEAVLLHLGPSCLAAARAVAGLRAAEATRDLPLLIVLDKNPPREETFLAGAVRDLVGRPNFNLANLPGELAGLLG